MERELVTREGVRFEAIPAGAIHGVGAAQAVRNTWRIARGVLTARRWICAFRPEVVFLTGGFVGVPVSLAALQCSVPSVVYLPDIEPGLALRLMARFAARVAVTAEASGAFVPRHKMVVTGYPLRDGFGAANRHTARQALNLPPDQPVVLIYGGSKGARSINRATLGQLERLLEAACVLHISGAADWEAVRARREALSAEMRARYRVFPYLHEEMAHALACADVVLCRAGASVLGELTAIGVPAILVPYPYAWRYQMVNARYLADRGAAEVLPDDQLQDGERGLAARVIALLHDAERRRAMRTAALALARRDAAQTIAQLISQVARAR